MYYLVGCLKGIAADAVRSIPVSGDNYKLAWDTLENRFNRPRLVATSLVDKLLHAPAVSHESLTELNKFVCLFSEGTSLLEALQISNMGSFMLFSVAFQCLPIAMRKQFEQSTTSDYPTVDELLEFVQSRVAILELVGEPRKSNPPAQPRIDQSSGKIRKGGDRLWQSAGSRPTSLVTSKVDNTCPCCSGTHALSSCNRFKSWTVEDRTRWTREKRLCYICFSADHWVPKCASKTRCRDCSRKHHHLLHTPIGDQRSDDNTASLCAAAPPPSSCPPGLVVLGTAMVHMRDRAGTWHTMRALS
jgi:hypothetical protein